MPSLRTIEIDFDIFKLIQNERKGFDEPDYLALRRLLRLQEINIKDAPKLQGRPFIEDGVSIPEGSLARMEYQRSQQIYEGVFKGGQLVVNGKGYSALSAAASDLAVTKKGKKTSLNGWIYWQVKRPEDSDWVLMDNLRPKMPKV
ncbi:hypothetical protein OAC01_01820 [bacterium]|nr:hypothetical protein [bacterium]